MRHNLQALFENAAHALAGRKVRVEFERPRTKGATGEALLGWDSVPVVTVLPVDDGAELLRVFLHECAHVKLHSGDWLPGEYIDFGAGTLDTFWARQARIIKERENDANKLTAEWLAYANRYAPEHMGSSVLERQLRALIITPEIRGIMDRAIMKMRQEIAK